MTELAWEINMRLQEIICQNKIYVQEQEFEIFYWKNDNFLEVDNEEAIVLDQEFVFPKPYYEENNLWQTPAEIKDEKQKNIEYYLKLASEYFAEDFNATENIEKENYVDLKLSAVGIINDDLTVNNKPTFEEWFIDYEFVEQYLKIT